MGDKKKVEITFQEEGLTDIRKKLGDMEKRAPAVQANTLNRTQTALKKFLPQRVKGRYTYDSKLQKPRQKRASKSNLSAVLFYDRQYHGLQHFSFNPGSAGSPRTSPGAKFAAKVQSDGGFKDISRAFVHEDNIFRRDGPSRKPLSRLVGPSEHSMVRNVWQEEQTQDYTGKQLSKNLDEQINNQYLKKWGLK